MFCHPARAVGSYSSGPPDVETVHIVVSNPVQGDTMKPPVDLDLRCSAILPGQQPAIIAARQLPKLLELSQQLVFINEMGHPVH